ncbi:Ropporin-1-like protein [Dufourea novaeangliae]|uniref:Ropporin-1-like protein n=1 Tax=Dufourea novaeangliae TaxID=178035 RepID=A0A154PG71_DUFNO|nr:Ropporin-1-like protein [Dufourea novaeangliae]
MSDDVIYCAEQIKIPPTFPEILKVYVKSAIRTQPYDLLRWTCAYFRALANQDVPPVKERLEYPPFVHPTGVTPGYLKTLFNAFGPVEYVCIRSLLDRWQGMALPETTLYQILLVGKFTSARECHFYKFLAIACGFLGKNLFETMIYVCELLTEEPEGGSAMIPLPTFLRLYGYLAELNCSGEYPCVCEEKDTETEEPFQPCGPTSVSDETTSSTFESRLYPLPCTDIEGEEEHTGVDICGVASSENRSSGSLTVLKDYDSDTRPSELDDNDTLVEGIEILPIQPGEPQPRIEVGKLKYEIFRVQPTDQPPEKSKSEPVTDRHRDRRFLQDSRDSDKNDLSTTQTGDSFYLNFGEEEGEFVTPRFEEVDDYVPIGLEDILHGICECLEPVRETVRDPTPPPPDPLEVFLERMKNEVNEGRLQTVFRVPGIGSSISSNRITAIGLWLGDCARRQEGLVGPRNIRHFLCPDLQEDCDDNYIED